MRGLLYASRVLATILLVAAALLAVRWLWLQYEMQPWTRDGRVRADIVQITPDVSGLVTAVSVHDNEIVHAGDVLLTIDQSRYKLALRQADATVALQRALLAQAEREDRRNHALSTIVAAETSEQSETRVAQLKSMLDQVSAKRDLAALNLDRTVLRASVDGVVSNMELRPGDYLAAGRPALALVFTKSLHIDGYFEETKLPAIRIGDRARVWLMGETDPALGHVESITGGVEDRERGTGSFLLANVNPTFSWVRLPQRIPVRIALDHIPSGMRLVPGLTATVAITPSGPPIVRRGFPW